MIVKMTGIVSEVRDQSVVIERDGLGYEVLVPGCAVGELSAHRGREVVLHTLEFLEGNAAGGNMVPRLVGFLHGEDRTFFYRFIEVVPMKEHGAFVRAWIPAGVDAPNYKVPVTRKNRPYKLDLIA